MGEDYKTTPSFGDMIVKALIHVSLYTVGFAFGAFIALKFFGK